MKKNIIFKILLIIVLCFTIGSNVVEGAETQNSIRSIYFKNSEVEEGGRIYVKLNAAYLDGTTKITGYFGNGKDSYLSLDLKDVFTTKPYFAISQMKAGDTYKMTMLRVEDLRGAVTYTVADTPNGLNPNLYPQGKNVVTITEKGKLKLLYLMNESETNESETEVDGQLKLWLETTANADTISVCVRNKNIWTKSAIVYLTKTAKQNEYILNLANGSNELIEGDYYISDVFIYEKSENKALHYSSYSEGSDILPLNYDVEFKLKKAEEPEKNEEPKKENEPEKAVEPEKIDLLKSISIKNKEAKLNEKVSVSIDTNKKLSSAELVFNDGTENITVNLNELNSSNTYFIVPITTMEGTYKLDYLTLKDIDGKEYQYRSGEDYNDIKHFDFNITLTIKSEEESSDLLNIDNAKITNEVLEKIKKLKNNAVIEVNANDNPNVSKELFAAIKDTNRTLIIKNNNLEWAFNGTDIEEEKQIDVTTNIYKTNREAEIAKKAANGLIIDFSNNGVLPGKSLIKIYNSEKISQVLNKKNANVYYYNAEEDKFEIVKLNVEYNIKGYYEFYINHNSKYVITADKIADQYLLESNKAVENNINFKLIVIISILVIILITTVIFLIRKRKSN